LSIRRSDFGGRSEDLAELVGGRGLEKSRRKVEENLLIRPELVELLFGLAQKSLGRSREEDVCERVEIGRWAQESVGEDARRVDRLDFDELELCSLRVIPRCCWGSESGKTRSATEEKEQKTKASESEREDDDERTWRGRKSQGRIGRFVSKLDGGGLRGREGKRGGGAGAGGLKVGEFVPES